MSKYTPKANKRKRWPLGPLDSKAVVILEEIAPERGFLRYRKAVDALARLRVDRRTAMRLLSVFEEWGILEARCGHGIRLRRRGEGR